MQRKYEISYLPMSMLKQLEMKQKSRKLQESGKFSKASLLKRMHKTFGVLATGIGWIAGLFLLLLGLSLAVLLMMAACVKEAITGWAGQAIEFVSRITRVQSRQLARHFRLRLITQGRLV